MTPLIASPPPHGAWADSLHHRIAPSPARAPRRLLVQTGTRREGKQPATEPELCGDSDGDGEEGHCEAQAPPSPCKSACSGAGELTCAICLGDIPLEDMAMVKSCDHIYCGEQQSIISAARTHRTRPLPPRTLRRHSSMVCGRLDWEIVKRDPKIYIGISQGPQFDAQSCAYCGGIKPLEDFSPKKHNKSGYNRVCRECVSIKSEIRAA